MLGSLVVVAECSWSVKFDQLHRHLARLYINGCAGGRVFFGGKRTIHHKKVNVQRCTATDNDLLTYLITTLLQHCRPEWLIEMRRGTRETQRGCGKAYYRRLLRSKVALVRFVQLPKPRLCAPSWYIQ